eukprot:g16367.t1
MGTNLPPQSVFIVLPGTGFRGIACAHHLTSQSEWQRRAGTRQQQTARLAQDLPSRISVIQEFPRIPASSVRRLQSRARAMGGLLPP